MQSFNIQAVGQRLTARIREDLFAIRWRCPCGFMTPCPWASLLTRLTSDVDALAEVFGSGAVGVLGDLVTLLVIASSMLLIEWRLGLLLLLTQIPVTAMVLWFQRRYRKVNYTVREELSQLNADFQENLQGLEVVQMFRREAVNGARFARTGSPSCRQRHDLFRQQHLGLPRVGVPGGRGPGARPRRLHGDQRGHGAWHPHHLHPLFPAPV